MPWDQWPQSQFASLRSGADGEVRGQGDLYGAGPGYRLTGVYYNKTLLAELGGEVPTTLAEMEALMQTAHDAGYTGLLAQGKDGGSVYPIQNLAMIYGGSAPIQAWNFNEPDATIDTPAMVEAAATAQEWATAGWVNADVNSIDNTTAPASFAEGATLFWSSGNWQAPVIEELMPGEVGFILLFPSENEGDTRYAMSASLLLAAPAHAEHKDAAVAFLDYVQTDEAARQITFDQMGLLPAGPADSSVPEAPDGAKADTATQFAQASSSDGLVEFVHNATASISVNTFIPQTQLLFSGRVTPEEFAAKVQSDYESGLGR